ncbi:basic secretory family protein [Lentzea sp. HUAS12]|uniref:basic secretory family protein n=1 Tax=Lentzea sp. HUAS12 TaxID=2951806 RepID=UPI00209E6872|nr:basic secretory family protein [Lentzea sp. HUAS12]USX48270.1 basic secretory family protein [Lentzea sp. HUAS12]
MRHLRTLLAITVAMTFLLGVTVALRPVEAPPLVAPRCDESVLTTASGTVTSSSCDGELASRVSGLLDTSVDGVADILDISWVRRVDVVVPASGSEFVTLVGPAFADMAGVAIRDGSGQRVVLNRVRAAALSDLELKVLLRHEITHVATRDLTSDSAPLWLVEGFADWVAFHGLGLSLRQTAPLLTPEVSALPVDFGGAGRDLAYQQAYSVVVYLESGLGERGVVDFYLRYASSSAVDSGVVDVAGWRDFLIKSIG